MVSGTADVDVAIIGGGLAGGSAGCIFGDRALSVRLFERRDLSRDPNRGDILHPPTIEIAERYGVYDRLIERGATKFHQLEITDPKRRLNLHSPVQPCLVLNHAELEGAFLDAAIARGVDVHNTPARELRRDGDRWVVTTDEGETRARFLVGGDGADSLVRRTLGIETAEVFDYPESIVVLHADQPDWLPDEAGFQLLHPQGAVFVLPTTPAGRVRLVVFVRREDGKFWATSSEAELSAKLGERFELLRGISVTKRGGSHVYRIRKMHAARYWGDHAAITGDAVHTINPMGGQGLNLAVQDSAALAEAVAPVLAAGGDDAEVAAALVAYEARRRPINRATVGWAHWSSGLARPGWRNYRRALRFYGKAKKDPMFVKEFSDKFGGEE